MKKVLLSVLICAGFMACKKKQITPSNEGGSATTVQTKSTSGGGFTLNELKSTFSNVGAFHNQALADYYVSVNEIPEDLDGTISQFSQNSVEASQDELNPGEHVELDYDQFTNIPEEDAELPESLEDELGISLSNEFKEAYSQMMTVLNDDLSVAQNQTNIDLLMEEHFGLMANDTEKCGLVAMGEVMKASYAYWDANLSYWGDKYGENYVLGKSSPIAKADAKGAASGGIRGAVTGTFVGGAPGFMGGAILGTAFGALFGSTKAAVKSIQGKK